MRRTFDAKKALKQMADEVTPPVPPVLRHGGIGIASFLAALLALAFMFSGMSLAASPTSTEVYLITAMVFLGLILGGMSGGLGIAGLCNKDLKKIFPVLGITIRLGVVSLCAAVVAFNLSHAP